MGITRFMAPRSIPLSSSGDWICLHPECTTTVEEERGERIFPRWPLVIHDSTPHDFPPLYLTSYSGGGKKFFLRPLLYRKEGKGQFRFWGKDEREYFLSFSSLSDEGKGVCRQKKAKKWGKEMWGLGLVGWGNSISLPTTRTRGRKNWINMMEMDPFFLGNEERRLPSLFPFYLYYRNPLRVAIPLRNGRVEGWGKGWRKLF